MTVAMGNRRIHSRMTPARASALDNSACELEIVGPMNAPLVVVLGGISATRHVTASPDDPRPGWWDAFVGPGKTIDTRTTRVVGMNYPGVCVRGRPLSTRDHALALSRALSAAGISRVHGIVGASYGGMLALAFASLEPDRAGALVVIGAAHESAPVALVHRTLQRRVVELGLEAGFGREALVIARGLAMTTYSTAEDFAVRFGQSDGVDATGRSAIGTYFAQCGERFAESCTPERFLALSRALDLHSVAPENIRTATTLIGVEEDALVPVYQLRDLARRIGSRCTLGVVSSRYGHDTFLCDPQLIAPFVTRALTQASGTDS